MSYADNSKIEHINTISRTALNPSGHRAAEPTQRCNTYEYAGECLACFSLLSWLSGQRSYAKKKKNYSFPVVAIRASASEVLVDTIIDSPYRTPRIFPVGLPEYPPLASGF